MKTNKLNYLHLALLCIFCMVQASTSLVFSQVQFTQASYKINEQCGLNSTEAYHVMKDRQNNLWISTDMGLVRYDGYNATSFTTKNGLPSNVIFHSYEDPFGRIWALSIKNQLYCIEKDSVYPYAFNHILDTLMTLEDVLFKRILITSDSTLHYSNSYHGSFQIDKHGKYTAYENHNYEFEVNAINDDFLLSCWPTKGTKDFNINTPRNYRNTTIDSLYFHKPSDISDLKNNKERNTVEGVVLVGGRVISIPSNTVIEKEVTSIERIPNTNVFWIGKNNHAYKAKFINNKLVPLANSKVLHNLYISSILVDNEGNTWFTTLEEGIIFLPEYKVNHLTDVNGNKFEEEVLDFVIDKNNVILSLKHNIINVQNNTRYPSDYSKLIFTHNKFIISNLAKIDQEYSIKSFPYINLVTPHARDFFLHDNYIYATTSFLYRINVVTDELDTLYRSFTQQRFLSQVAVYENQVYVSTKNNLFRLGTNNDLEPVINLGNKEITDLYVYNKQLLIATKNFGIFQYDGTTFRPFLNATNGLNNEKVNVLSSSENGRYLYIGCFKGLEIYDKFTNKSISISKNQGLTDLKINRIEQVNDELYIATEKGFYKLDYNDIRNLSNINVDHEIHPIVTNLRVDGENYKNLISLPTDSKVLTIDFQVKDLKNWFNKKYQYQINGGEWITLLSPEIILTNPQKKIKINLRYLMSNNSWSDSTVLIQGSIREPFYTSAWFILVLVVLVGFTVFLILKGINSNKIKKLEQENEMLSYQQRMQNARMKPHFIFNVLNSIYSFILFNENKNAANYLLKFSTLMRSVLENSSDEKVKINDEVKLLENYMELENLRHDNSFNYDIKIHNTDKFLEIPSLMIQPFVENAIIHGINHEEKACRIQIDIEKLNDQIIEVKIFNTGKTSDEIISKLNLSDDKNAVGITKARLKNYNNLNHYEMYKMEAEKLSNGTLIKLFIPIL